MKMGPNRQETALSQESTETFTQSNPKHSHKGLCKYGSASSRISCISVFDTPHWASWMQWKMMLGSRDCIFVVVRAS